MGAVSSEILKTSQRTKKGHPVTEVKGRHYLIGLNRCNYNLGKPGVGPEVDVIPFCFGLDLPLLKKEDRVVMDRTSQ